MLEGVEDRTYRALLSLEGMKPEALRTAWEAMPSGARQRPALIAAYARALARAGASDEAAAQLGVALKRDWDPELVRAYGLVPAADAAPSSYRQSRERKPPRESSQSRK